MNTTDHTLLRGFIGECLQANRDQANFTDSESLFASGRLDSLSVTKLVVFLEEKFEVDFSNVAFDVDLLDSIDAIAAFLDQHRKSPASK